ncbi:MAG: transcription factor S [Nanoarchaeota archaeon]
MMFCEKCGALMIPKKDSEGKKIIGCSKCRNVSTKREHLILREQVDDKQRKMIEVVEKRVDILPKIKEDCPKCGHKEAYYWSVQTRAADEAETRFFKCVKCGHTWRSYT